MKTNKQYEALHEELSRVKRKLIDVEADLCSEKSRRHTAEQRLLDRTVPAIDLIKQTYENKERRLLADNTELADQLRKVQETSDYWRRQAANYYASGTAYGREQGEDLRKQLRQDLNEARDEIVRLETQFAEWIVRAYPQVADDSDVPRVDGVKEGETGIGELADDRVIRLYRRRTYRCYYCDYPCDSVDHVPPRGYAERMPDVQVIVVEACRECNNILNGLTLLTLGERKEYLRTWRLRHPRAS